MLRVALLERLREALPDVSIPSSRSLTTLLGHAIFHKLVTAKEIEETTPRTPTTQPCYLFTYVTDTMKRSQIGKYVVAASKLYRRGSIILNRLAQTVCGARLPSATVRGITVPVRRPQFRRDEVVSSGMMAMVELLAPVEGNIERNTLKHAFLPERWPSSKEPRRPEVAAILTDGVFGPILPPVPSDWLSIMPVTGWDNVINRMMSKFCGNIKVHAMANLPAAVKKYLNVVPLSPEAPRSQLIDAVFRPLCPLVASDDDWQMALSLRSILMGPSADKVVVLETGRNKGTTIQWFVYGYAPDKVSYSQDVLLLHLFLARYGTQDRSYLPVASRGRKYAYIDTKIATYLFPKPKRAAAGVKLKTPGSSKRGAATKPPPPPPPPPPLPPPQDEPDSHTVSVGQLLGITPLEFNRKRREIRRTVRKRKDSNYRSSRGQTDAQRKRLKAESDRWRRLGSSKIPRDARIDSIETDGVGLRMVLQRKIDMRPHIIAVPDTEDDAGSSAVPVPAAGRKRKRQSKKKSTPEPFSVNPLDDSLPKPVVVAMDNGRAKLFMAAISQSAKVKPKSQGFTRNRYYHEMGHAARQRWEQERIATSDALKHAVEQLSESCGLGSCDPECWRTYLTTETTHRTLLDDEYVGNVERAKWAMQLFRRKKSSLDGASSRLLKTALDGPDGRDCLSLVLW